VAGICVLCQVPLLKSETRGIFLHSVEPPLDHKSLLAVVEPGTLVILSTAACQLELFLAACSILHIPKFEEPVVARAHKLPLVRGPMHMYLSFFLYCSYALIIRLYQSNLVYRWVTEYLHMYVYILLTIDCETARNPNCLAWLFVPPLCCLPWLARLRSPTSAGTPSSSSIV